MSNHDLLEIALVLGTAGLGLLGKLVVSIVDLNKNIAVIVEKVNSHEKRIDRLETTVNP